MPPAKIESGEVLLEGENILQYKPNSAEMRSIRGGRVGMVFQEPMTSLNPVKTIGSQLMESIVLHCNATKEEARARAAELLEKVGIPDAAARLDDYPHQFSGGMRQRIMIAIAIAGNPDLIVADEPTTALDVTTQAQIVRQMVDLRDRFGTSIIIVTHNLGVACYMSDNIIVMKQGRKEDEGDRDYMLHKSDKEYTLKLLDAVPSIGGERYV
jgi:peptide/nickel transport system ATP-binding protein